MGITTFAIGTIRFYQLILSPIIKQIIGIPHSCRFTPTCSQYAISMLQAHGLLQGTKKAIIRLSKCHPFGNTYATI